MGKAAQEEIGYTFQEAVEVAVRWCEDAGLPPHQVITPEKLDMLRPDTLHAMARIGWVRAVSDFHHHQRPTSLAVVKETMAAAASGRNPRARWNALDVTYVGADGFLKALGEFTAADLDQMIGECAQQRKSWAARLDWARKAEQMVLRGKATTVSGLSLKDLDELRPLAEKAWAR